MGAHGISTGVRSFFRHVPHQLSLPSNMTLPVYARREYSKSVWDMQLHGVKGVINLVLIFPDQKSSLAGKSRFPMPAASTHLCPNMHIRDIKA